MNAPAACLITVVQYNRAEIENIRGHLRLFEQVKAANPAMRAYWREDNQAQFVAGLRKSKEQFAHFLLGNYDHDRNNAVVAPGEPPLTREMVNATLRLLAFLQAASNNAQAIDLAPRPAESWRRQLIAQYPKLGRDQRNAIADMPRIAAMVEVAWQQMSDVDRIAFAEQLREQFGAMLPPAPIGHVAASPEAATSMFGEQRRSSLMDAFDHVIEAQDAELAELEKTNPALALQQKLQNQQTNVQLLSTYLKTMQECSTAILRQ